jgi:hypothetical protein
MVVNTFLLPYIYYQLRSKQMKTFKLQVNLRLEQNEHEKITFIAKKNKRSFNAQVEFLVQKCVEQHEKKYGVINFPSTE